MGFSLQRALLGGLAGVGKGVADVYEQKAKDEVAANVANEAEAKRIAAEGRAEETYQKHTADANALYDLRKQSERDYAIAEEGRVQAKLGEAKKAAFEAARVAGFDPSSAKGLKVAGEYLESHGFEAQGQSYWKRGDDMLKYDKDVADTAETFKLKRQENALKEQEIAASKLEKVNQKELERYEKEQANIAKGVTYDMKDENGKMITVNVPQAQNDIETFDSMLPADMSKPERLTQQRKFARYYNKGLGEGQSAAVAAKNAFSEFMPKEKPAAKPAAPAAPVVAPRKKQAWEGGTTVRPVVHGTSANTGILNSGSIIPQGT